MLENHPQPREIKPENVLLALGNPIRLGVLQLLAQHGEQSCNTLRGNIAKLTMTHHWRVLRDSGVIWQRPVGRENLISRRRDCIDHRFPSLLEALLTAMVKR